MKIKFLAEQLKIFNKRISASGNRRYMKCWTDLMLSSIRFGASPEDYFRYEFFRKSRFEKNKFITYRRSKNLIRKYNNSCKASKVENKIVFNRLFAEFISRDWLDTGSCNYDDFQSFIIKHKEAVIKPPCGGKGKGIYKYSYRQEDDLTQKFKEIKGMLIEEVINQHKEMASLNPESVNTIRAWTLLCSGNLKILGCYIRTARDNSFIDNVSAGGICASVNIEDGVVFSQGVTEDFNKYSVHPFSGKQFTGLRIPHWDLLLETLRKVALVIPELGYLGWDFAILEDGVELIEVNHDPGHCLQFTDQIGRYGVIKKR